MQHKLKTSQVFFVNYIKCIISDASIKPSVTHILFKNLDVFHLNI